MTSYCTYCNFVPQCNSLFVNLLFNSSYDYNYPQGYAQPSVYDQGYGGAQSPYTGDIMTPEPMSPGSGGYSDNFEDEEPLLQGKFLYLDWYVT